MDQISLRIFRSLAYYAAPPRLSKGDWSSWVAKNPHPLVTAFQDTIDSSERQYCEVDIRGFAERLAQV
jgi:hypothetical protein